MKNHEKLQDSLDLIIEQDGNIIILDATLIEVNHYQALMKSLYQLLRNSDFQLIFHMQGIVASIEGLFEILLNEMLIGIFPGMERGADSAVVVMFREVRDGETDPAAYVDTGAADFVWFTPRIDDRNHCAELAKRFGKHHRTAPPADHRRRPGQAQ